MAKRQDFPLAGNGFLSDVAVKFPRFPINSGIPASGRIIRASPAARELTEGQRITSRCRSKEASEFRFLASSALFIFAEIRLAGRLIFNVSCKLDI